MPVRPRPVQEPADRPHGAGRRLGGGRRARLLGAASVVTVVVLAAFGQPSLASARGGAGRGARGPGGERPRARAASAVLGQLFTYDYDNARSGLDTLDPSLAGLRLLWSDSSSVISGGIYGQPLVDGNLVIVATEEDEVYALNASTGKVAWKFSIGRPASTSVIDTAPTLSSGCGDINPLGITGTPVIWPKESEIFVAGEIQSVGTSTWEGIKHMLVAAKFSATGVKILWDHEIDPPHADTTYYIPAEQQRPGLTLSNGRVYVEFGGLSGDCGDYQGYVVSLSELGTLSSFQYFKVPTSREGAIWATGGAATNAAGELFVATGNSADGPGQPYDYGDSVIGLSPSLKIESYFAPSDWAQRNTQDLDLGSGGPILLPNSNLLFEIGKAGADGVSTGFLLDQAKLGGIGHPLFSGTVCPDGGYVFGADATEILTIAGKKHTYVFVPCPRGTVALQVNYAGLHPTFSVKWRASSGDPNGPPIIAGGYVWALSTGADGGSGSPELYAMSPVTGKVEIMKSVNPVEHFATPGAGDATVFVASSDGLQAFKP